MKARTISASSMRRGEHLARLLEPRSYWRRRRRAPAQADQPVLRRVGTVPGAPGCATRRNGLPASARPAVPGSSRCSTMARVQALDDETSGRCFHPAIIDPEHNFCIRFHCRLPKIRRESAECSATAKSRRPAPAWWLRAAAGTQRGCRPGASANLQHLHQPAAAQVAPPRPFGADRPKPARGPG